MKINKLFKKVKKGDISQGMILAIIILLIALVVFIIFSGQIFHKTGGLFSGFTNLFK